MRVIPVIDLRNGQAVHAVRGERDKYRPVKSILCDTPDPPALARAFRDRLGLNEIYIADLDSIQGLGSNNSRDLIAAIALDENIEIILDAGVSGPEDARKWLRHGIRKVVVGSETVDTTSALREIPAAVDRDCLVFSLDMFFGKVLSKSPELRAMSPMDLLGELQAAGWQEIILLDLNRVGTGEGFSRPLISEARVNFPDLNFLVGGGIGNKEQLSDLKSLGVAGVLLATALHNGTITRKSRTDADERGSTPIP